MLLLGMDGKGKHMNKQDVSDLSVVMDRIDDAKQRGAVNDLSVIAYALVVELEKARSMTAAAKSADGAWL